MTVTLEELVNELTPNSDQLYSSFIVTESNEPNVFFIENFSRGISYKPFEIRIHEDASVTTYNWANPRYYPSIKDFAESFKEFITM